METRDTAKAPLTVARLRSLQESCDGDGESVGDGQRDGQGAYLGSSWAWSDPNWARLDPEKARVESNLGEGEILLV